MPLLLLRVAVFLLGGQQRRGKIYSRISITSVSLSWSRCKNADWWRLEGGETFIFCGAKNPELFTLTPFFLLVLRLPDCKHQLISVQGFKLDPSCRRQIQNSFVIHSQHQHWELQMPNVRWDCKTQVLQFFLQYCYSAILKVELHCSSIVK